MKNYQPSASAARANQPFVKLTRVRVALLFGLVAALSCLPFYVFAQDDVANVKSKRSSDYITNPDAGVFVMYQSPKGDTVCRSATITEARALRANDSKSGLHQINHLNGEKALSPGAVESPNANLTIILRATQQLEANSQAKAAFIAAAAKWEALIKDPITVIIDVDFGPTFFGTTFDDPTILGATGTQEVAFTNNYADIRSRLLSHASSSQETALYSALPASSLPTNLGNVTTIFAATPILRALGAINAVANPSTETNFGDPPKIAFNSGFAFDFDPSDGINGNRTDFDAVAVHEMGHALGFNSAVGLQELAQGSTLVANVWDLFRFRPGTANLNTFSTAQRILSTDGIQVQFNGGPELPLSTGNPQGHNGDGRQASHWKDDAQNGGIFIGIMDPTIAFNRREVMVENDINAIDSFGYTVVAATAPSNDNFSDAATLSGASGTVTGTNTGASKETGEPVQPQPNPPQAARPGGRSVWYNWTATGTGQTTVDTNGSNFDTTLAIYTGSAVNGLTLITANDDISPISDPEPRNLQSLVTFTASAGTTYRIQVDGYNPTDTGNITLHWSGSASPSPTPTPTPGPNTVQFTQSVASVNESDIVSLDLTVTRTGDLAAAATVNYATSNATASDRSDYETALGTLFFAAGESSKTIPLFMINDSFGETDETFNITLSGPASCTLGSPAAIQVTIHSNESVNFNNPIKNGSFNNDFFVRQHYLDFFNREPDAPGLAFWKNQLDECENVQLPAGFTDAQQCREIRRINVSAAFFLSIEFQQTGYLVERLYRSAYGNGSGTSTFGATHQLPVPIVRFSEFLADTQQIGRGVVIGNPGADQLLESNKQTLIAQFVQRARFTSAFPLSLTPAQFVDALNTNAGGVLSQSERNQLASDLTQGTKTRAQVLRAVAEDPDLFAAENNRAFVLAQFIGYLRRNPNDSPDADYTGYDFWLDKLNQFNGNFVNAEMVKAFIVAGEYQGRFGP